MHHAGTSVGAQPYPARQSLLRSIGVVLLRQPTSQMPVSGQSIDVDSSVATSAFELSRWRGGRYRVGGPSMVARVRFG
ncbi:MAG: hypothetical protein ABSD89_14160, partial [Halobacteriota archaeon]